MLALVRGLVQLLQHSLLSGIIDTIELQLVLRLRLGVVFLRLLLQRELSADHVDLIVLGATVGFLAAEGHALGASTRALFFAVLQISGAGCLVASIFHGGELILESTFMLLAKVVKLIVPYELLLIAVDVHHAQFVRPLVRAAIQPADLAARDLLLAQLLHQIAILVAVILVAILWAEDRAHLIIQVYKAAIFELRELDHVIELLISLMR